MHADRRSCPSPEPVGAARRSASSPLAHDLHRRLRRQAVGGAIEVGAPDSGRKKAPVTRPTPEGRDPEIGGRFRRERARSGLDDSPDLNKEAIKRLFLDVLRPSIDETGWDHATCNDPNGPVPTDRAVDLL